MRRYIDVDKLIEFANNTKDKTIDANDIARFPPANVRENVRGEWVDAVVGTSTGYTYHEKRCSICGHSEVLPMNFCPFCGADMRGGQHEKDN